MQEKGVSLSRKAVSIIMLILLLLSAQPLVFAAKFNLGDTVEVFNTGASGLLVRDAPAGNIIGKKYDGNRGMVLAGPQSASLGGVVYTWWMVRWGDDALEGWSAEDYLKYVYITPSTKFSIGNLVKVSTGGASLIVRTDPPPSSPPSSALSYKGSVADGTVGKVLGGPFYGVAKDTAGFYYFWKVDYLSVVGWSAEDWLTKVVGEPVITSSLVLIQSPPYYVGDTITARFTITNRATAPFTFDVLTVGGRDPDNQVADFTWIRSITLSPGASYNYQGTLTLTKVGNYHFFCAYRTLWGDWNPAIPTEGGATNTKDIWADSHPPYTPSNPSPSNHATGVSIYADLSWSGGDPDTGDTVTYDVYFGTSSSPPQVSNDQSATTYDPGTLNYGVTYYWKIVATDNHGKSTTGPIWDFTTQSAPPPPNQPPTLNDGYVSPSSGDTSTTFSYYVTYSDTEGDAPTTKYVYVDGSPYTMVKISGDYVSGAVFKYSTTLSAGSHNYYFYFEDSVHGHAVRLPTTGTYSGPNVSPPPAPDFSISASPTSLTIQQGSSGTSTITITSINGFNQPVQLSVSGAPSGVTATLNPQQVTPPAGGSTTSTLTVSVAMSATPGSYPLIVTGISGPLTRNTYISLEITTVPTSEQPQLKAPWVGVARITQGNKGTTSHYDHGTWDNTYAIDVALPVGSDVLAPADGVVKYVDNDPSGAGGKELAIEHTGPTGKKSVTVYLHLNDILVKEGDSVKQGQIVAKSGATGDASGPHLHFHIWRPKGSEPEWAYDSHTMPIERLVMKQVGVDDDFREYDDRKGELDDDKIAGKLFESNNTPASADDIYWLAKAIVNEAGGVDISEQERIAVGWTVLNRLYCGRFGESVQEVVVKGYAPYWTEPHKEPTDSETKLAEDLLAQKIQDPTDGATHFFSPRSQIIGYGPYPVPGTSEKALYPWWAEPRDGWQIITETITYYVTIKNELEWRQLEGIRNWYFMFYRPYTTRIHVERKSPVEVRVYDSQGRVTGLVNGTVVIEIPRSDYFENTVTIFFPNETYRYVAVGVTEGLYGLVVTAVAREENITFSAINIPTSAGAVHQCSIDWGVLSRGEEGVTVEVDSNGDRVFEHIFTSDSELTQSEFLAQTALPVLYTFSIVWGTETFIVSVESNSTVSNFAFNQPNKEISFNVTGLVDTIGICNVTIPKALLYGEPWTVLIDGVSVLPTITENATHSCLYFTYTHSTHEIQIIGTWVIAPPSPPTYSLAITTTVGGTTNPAPGTYSYTANSPVQVTAIPAANYLFDYWELDGVNVGSANPYSVYMDKDHTLKAVFSHAAPPLSTSISPLSASILVGQSVTFTSTVSGGYAPYSYQWNLNSAPFSGATLNTWAFTPTTSGIYYVYLKVTDAKGNTTQSETARITVATVPVGGYSIPIQVHTNTEPIIPYIALIAILTAIFTKLRPKTKRKH